MNKHPRNYVTENAALTGISGAATTYSSSEFDFCLDGKANTKAAVSGGTTPTTDDRTGSAITLTANNGCVVVWAVESDDTVVVYKGDTEALDGAGNFITAPQFPEVPDTAAAFAYTVHKAGSTLSGTFTFGSSNWNTTGMTHAAVSVMQLPSRPQVS